MPFCTRCGNQVAASDTYCASCGRPQAPAAHGPAPDPLAGISPRLAATLCYIPTMGWIPAVIVLTSRKFRHDRITRFHAFQGLYLFAFWLVVQWVIRPIFWNAGGGFRPDHLLDMLLLVLSIFMLIRASDEVPYVLPIVGELAQRSAAEQ